jgi:hypothetical protein
LWGWGALEADFWHYYRIDLQKEGFGGSLSWRKFLILIRGLPADSAFHRWLANSKDQRDLAEWNEDSIDVGGVGRGV